MCSRGIAVTLVNSSAASTASAADRTEPVDALRPPGRRHDPHLPHRPGSRRRRPPRLHQPRPRPGPARRPTAASRRCASALIDVLDAAYAQGVRYFDAARSYGRSEEFLADWLRERPDVDDVVVGSKWGYTYTADWSAEAERHEVK